MRTLSVGAWAGGCAVVMGLLAVPVAAQRQRVPPASDSTTESRTAQERDVAPRAAQPRPPAPAPAPPASTAAPVPPSSSGHGGAGERRHDDAPHDRRRGDREPRGEVDSNGFVRPTIVRPVIVSPVIVQPVILPSPTSMPPESRRWSGGREWPYDRDDHGIDLVLESAPRGPAPVGASRGYTLAPGGGVAEYDVPAGRPGAFVEWYALTEHVSAGFPIPYPEEYANTYDRAQFTNRLEGNEPAVREPAAANGIVPGAPLVPYEVGNYGGLTFDVTPGDALVYIDGLFVGSADDFAPGGAPLPLPAMLHKVQLRARGLQTETFEVTVPLGQVMPIRGTLRRVAGR